MRAKSVWWPRNPGWSLVQWLPREQGSDTETAPRSGQEQCKGGAETSPRQRKSRCKPEELMVRTEAETILVEQETAWRPRQQPGKSKTSTGTQRNQKETANKETGPWAETGTCPRRGQMTEPKGMPRTSTANETAGRWRPAGPKPERTHREQPVRRHALLIAVSPDGQYMKPGERRWESEEMTKETRYRNEALRDAAQQKPVTQADGCTLT